jgi:hypothetical protein
MPAYLILLAKAKTKIRINRQFRKTNRKKPSKLHQCITNVIQVETLLSNLSFQAVNTLKKGMNIK